MHLRKALRNSFHLNGHSLGFYPQTQEREPHERVKVGWRISVNRQLSSFISSKGPNRVTLGNRKKLQIEVEILKLQCYQSRIAKKNHVDTL